MILADDSRLSAIVVTSFDPNQPGFLDFSYRLKALNKQFSLTVLGQGLLERPEFVLEGAELIQLKAGSGKFGWLRYLGNAAKYINKHKPDLVVLLHSATAPVALLIGRVSTVLYWNEHPTNLIRISHGMSLPKRLLSKSMHKLIYYSARKVDLVMPIGEDHLDDLLIHGVSQDKLKMIYMGVADDFLSATVEREYKSERLNLIYVGTVSARRGRDVMLDAMRLLAKERLPVHLTIIGASNEELAKTQEKINSNGLSDFVSVYGRVPGYDIPKYLAGHDVGICIWEKNTAYEFNPPTKLFEYLAAGLPVLASNIRTHSRYIHEGMNGWIFEYTPESLANCIRQISTHHYRLPDFKERAHESGKAYLWSAVEPTFLTAVHSVLGR